MARRTPPRKVRYFEPVAPRLARNTVIKCGRVSAVRTRQAERPGNGQWDLQAGPKLKGKAPRSSIDVVQHCGPQVIDYTEAAPIGRGCRGPWRSLR